MVKMQLKAGRRVIETEIVLPEHVNAQLTIWSYIFGTTYKVRLTVMKEL